MTTHPDRAIAILHDLVATPSVNPAYDPASPGERDVAAYVIAWAERLGLPARTEAVFPGRDNVLVELAGPTGSPTLLLEAHMDTVSADTMPDAFTPIVRDGLLYGRGACDTKGSLAAMMAAVELLAAERTTLACSVTLLAAIDEETVGNGVDAYVAAGGRPDAAIVGEPTQLRVIHAHNGCLRGDITVIGQAAHTSVAHEGRNAITGMADVIQAMDRLDRELAARPGGPERHGSLTVSLIHGGTGVNIVPERCTISYDRRSVPGDLSADLLAEIDAALERVRTRHPELTIVREVPALDLGALLTAPDATITRAASAANAAILHDPTPTTVPYGSDASILSLNGGIPTIVYGPGSIAHAHSATEHVALVEVADAARFYAAAARAFGELARA